MDHLEACKVEWKEGEDLWAENANLDLWPCRPSTMRAHPVYSRKDSLGAGKRDRKRLSDSLLVPIEMPLISEDLALVRHIKT